MTWRSGNQSSPGAGRAFPPSGAVSARVPAGMFALPGRGECPCWAEDSAVPPVQVEGTLRPAGRRAGSGPRHTRKTPGRWGSASPGQAPYSKQRKQIMKDPAAVLRSMARLQYTIGRLPLALLDEGIVARYWGHNALVRRGLERYLGSLDLLAGWLLADDEVSQRGQTLMRGTGYLERNGAPSTDAPPQLARARQILQARQARVLQAGAQDRGIPDTTATYQEQQDQQHVRYRVGGMVAAGSAPPAAEETPTGAAGQPGTSGTPAAKAGIIDITFTLPAEVHAGTVALCGSSTTGRLTISGSSATATAPGGRRSPSSRAVATVTGTCSTANAGRTPAGRPLCAEFLRQHRLRGRRRTARTRRPGTVGRAGQCLISTARGGARAMPARNRPSKLPSALRPGHLGQQHVTRPRRSPAPHRTVILPSAVATRPVAAGRSDGAAGPC